MQLKKRLPCNPFTRVRDIKFEEIWLVDQLERYMQQLPILLFKMPFRRKGDSVKSVTTLLKGWVPWLSSPVSCLQCPKHLLGFSETWRALAAGSEELLYVLILQQNRGLSGSKHGSRTCAYPLFGAEDSEGNKDANLPQRHCRAVVSMGTVRPILPLIAWKL